MDVANCKANLDRDPILPMIDEDWDRFDDGQGEGDLWDVVSVDAIVETMYDCISFRHGDIPDWDRLRFLFHPDARLVQVRTDGIHTLDIGKFVSRYAQAVISGAVPEYHEREIARRTETFGPIAHVWSTYESTLRQDDPESVRRGINNFQIIRHDSRWWLFTMLWTKEHENRPLPAEYFYWS